jgi:hypothetical protein
LVDDCPPAEADSDDFDAAIIEQSVMLSVASSEFPAVEEVIVRHWYDLGKSKPGYPGFLLARELLKLPPGALPVIERWLRDLRSTIHDSDTAVAYFSACLCLAQSLHRLDRPQPIPASICQAALSKVTGIVAPQLQKLFMKSLGARPASPEFHAQVADFCRVISRFQTPSLLFLCGCIVDELDCLLSNAAVTQASLNSLSLVLAANTAASTFTTASKISLPRFRQVLLCVLAHDEILQNPRAVLELAPLIPPTFVYFLLCHVRPDEHLPDPLDYQRIEAFAKEMNVNLSQNVSIEIVFKPEPAEMPAECADFVFQ